MRSLAVLSPVSLLSQAPRALLAAALLALGPGIRPLQAQADLATLRTRAEAGDAEALNTLGNLSANGQGTPQDDAAALRFYTQAAARGHAPAQFNLGLFTELGRATAADPAAAFQLYLKAAQQGFAPAQFNVGNMYANGRGVGRDYFEATLWFRQAAEQGVGADHQQGHGHRPGEHQQQA